ncbi:MAG: hypothetical protein ACFCU1_11425 [Sumerlaeia bacterium]
MSYYNVGDKNVIKRNRERATHEDNVGSGMMWIAIVGALTLLNCLFAFNAVDPTNSTEVNAIIRMIAIM